MMFGFRYNGVNLETTFFEFLFYIIMSPYLALIAKEIRKLIKLILKF